MTFGPEPLGRSEFIGPDAPATFARDGLLEPMQHTKKVPARPFFARFLDRQDLKKIDGGNSAGSDATDKYPSDKDEHASLSEGD